MALAAVVLAAGKGTRMKSQLTKVLHGVCGRPMVEYVLEAAEQAGAQKTVLVVGHGAKQVMEQVGATVDFVEQKEQLGTAHALMQTKPLLEDWTGDIIVVCGDTPLLRGQTLGSLVQAHRQNGYMATVLTATLPDAGAYGRIFRDADGNLQKIIEYKDANDNQRAVREVNTGVYCFKAQGLFAALATIGADNAQGEFYLTDIIAHFVNQGQPVGAVTLNDEEEMTGINDRMQLAAADKIMRRRILEKIMSAGVTVLDPDSTFIGSDVHIGQDSIIYPFTIVEGKSKIGENCTIGPSCRLVNVAMGDCVTVTNSVILDSAVGDGCNIGPFAYIRPGCKLEPDVKVGDFVEIKNSQLSRGCKIPHLSYVGDAFVGAQANIGAGTITCNYDGTKKSITRIGAHAFIGSNTNLIAPVEIGEGAITGAGSTITKDVPSNALGVTRSKQKIINDWIEKKKQPNHSAE